MQVQGWPDNHAHRHRGGRCCPDEGNYVRRRHEGGSRGCELARRICEPRQHVLHEQHAAVLARGAGTTRGTPVLRGGDDPAGARRGNN